MCDELAPSLCSEVYRPFLSLSCKSILCDQLTRGPLVGR